MVGRMSFICIYSIVPVTYKAMCIIIHARLAQVVEEKNLVEEEQSEFRHR